MGGDEDFIRAGKNARTEKQKGMLGKDIHPSLGKISDVTEMTTVVRIEQLLIDNGRKANLNVYVHDVASLFTREFF